MPPLPHTPKVVVYHQTHHTRDGEQPVSILPLLGGDGGRPSATHVIVAALHVNGPDTGASPSSPSSPSPPPSPPPLTLNDHAPDHPRFDVLWHEVAACQARGVRVLALLGGAARGTYARLDVGAAGVTAASFERHYAPLHALLRRRRFDGVDLDVEEPTTLDGIVHLIDRLRRDFGPRFLLTMAPVAAALLRPHDPRCNALAGFSYADVERRRGRDIAWYHAQFYCGWGDAAQPHMYAAIAGLGPGAPGMAPGPGGPAPAPPFERPSPAPAPWGAHRVVMGLLVNPANGPGFVPLDTSAQVLMQLQAATAAAGTAFAGVSGWEYFNALPGGEPRPWEWAEWMAAILGASVDADGQAGHLQAEVPTMVAVAEAEATPTLAEADPDSDSGPDAPVPRAFDYASDTED